MRILNRNSNNRIRDQIGVVAKVDQFQLANGTTQDSFWKGDAPDSP